MCGWKIRLMAACAPASTCRGKPTAVDELELLLELDGTRFEMAPGVIVEFSARRVDQTPQRPHGVAYAFVMRPKAGGAPWVRFDNSHRSSERRRSYGQRQVAYDHWHRTPYDRGSPYNFSTAVQLLDDFWREVKRTLDEQGIPNDL
jgi:hypothetical protein